MSRKKYYFMAEKQILWLCVYLTIGVSLSAQVTPNTQTQPGAGTGTISPIPSAYSPNIMINYVRTWTAEKPFSLVTDISSDSRTVQEVKQATQYVDGLGRPLQTVAKGISPAGFDLVTPVIYDAFGRERYKYLPYVSPGMDGSFKKNAFKEDSSFLRAFYNSTNDAN